MSGFENGGVIPFPGMLTQAQAAAFRASWAACWAGDKKIHLLSGDAEYVKIAAGLSDATIEALSGD